MLESSMQGYIEGEMAWEARLRGASNSFVEISEEWKKLCFSSRIDHSQTKKGSALNEAGRNRGQRG